MSHIAFIVAAAIALPNGAPPKHIREQPPEQLEQDVSMAVDAARMAHVPELLYLALITGESAWNERAVSPNGTSVWLPQLNRFGHWYRVWQDACRTAPSQCRFAGFSAGAYALGDALRRCMRDRACAVAKYRGARTVRPRDRAVVRLAQRFAFRMRQAPGLVAWEGGQL